MEIFIEEQDVKQKKKMVAFEINQEWYDILKATADDEMISVSNMIRKLIYNNCIKQKFLEKSNEKELNQ